MVEVEEVFTLAELVLFVVVVAVVLFGLGTTVSVLSRLGLGTASAAKAVTGANVSMAAAAIESNFFDMVRVLSIY